MSKAQTAFSPVPHGFRFPNYFEFKLPDFQLPLVGKVDLNDVIFGLCGGMCFTALDYFYQQTPLPLEALPDKIDRKLFTYLCERQIDSMQVVVLLKIVDWMVSDDAELAARMTRTELPKLRRQLEKGDPAVLCLIRTHGFGDPTHNHQVLATGYDLDEAAKSMVIQLYDPNHPTADSTIRVSLARPGFRLEQSTGEPLRGLFIMPYRPQTGLPVRPAPQAPRELPGAAISFDLPGVPAAPEPAFRLRWPVDGRKINQRFGDNPAMYRPFKLAGHEGVDFFALSGAKIYACFDGVVSEAKYRGAYGNQVRIRHTHDGLGFTTVYAHLQKMLCVAGQEVKAGDIIGLADNTGNSNGAHLHLTLFVDGARTPGYYDGIVDPWPYLEGNEPPPPPTLSGVTVYTLQSVNLRALPSTDAEIITLLPGGEELPVFGDAAAAKARIGKKDQWLQVQTGAGQTGYIAAWLTADLATQSLPPAELVVYAFDTLVLRSGPSLGLGPVVTVAPTDPLNVMGSTDTARARVGQPGQWLQVQTQGGARGFAPAWLVHVTGQVPPPVGLTVYPTGNVNVRCQPSTTSDVVAVVAPGDALTVLGDRAQAQSKIGRQDLWINVQSPNSVTGWVAAWLMTLQAPPPVPAAAVPAKTGAAAAGGLLVYPTPPAGVNIRATADVDAMRVGGAAQDEPLSVLESDLIAARAKIGEADSWLYVQNSAGLRGWVAAWFVRA